MSTEAEQVEQAERKRAMVEFGEKTVRMPVARVTCPHCGEQMVTEDKGIVETLRQDRSVAGSCSGCGKPWWTQRSLIVRPNQGANRHERRALAVQGKV